MNLYRAIIIGVVIGGLVGWGTKNAFFGGAVYFFTSFFLVSLFKIEDIVGEIRDKLKER